MKKQYQTPEMEIAWFETESICTVSDFGDGTDFIPETFGKDPLGW